jgi:hypothetical protein
VAFPSDDPAEFARRNLELWGAGTLKCRGNGDEAAALVVVKEYEKYQAAREKAAGAIVVPPVELWSSTARAGDEARRQGPEPERRLIPCLGLGVDGAPPCPKVASGDCTPSMHIHVIVRGFPGLGIFQLDTGSVVNIAALDDFVNYLGTYTGGRFAMLPLVMRLEPYAMRGREYFGLKFDVDFAALAAGGAGALPMAAQLSIPDRVLAYLPEPSWQPLPAGLDVDDEPPVDGPSDAARGSDDGTPEGRSPEPPQVVTPPVGSHISAAVWSDVAPGLRGFLARWPGLEEAEEWLRREVQAGDVHASVVLRAIVVRQDMSRALRFTDWTDDDARALALAIEHFQTAGGQQLVLDADEVETR